MTNAYLEVISLIERLHRHFLEVVKLELEGLGIHDINNVQGMMLFNIGDAEMTVGELTLRGCYLGSNVSYNVKKMVENGYLVQERSLHDRRSIRVRLTGKGTRLRDQVSVMLQRQLEMLSQATINMDDLQAVGMTLRRLERFWIRAGDLVQRPPNSPPDFAGTGGLRSCAPPVTGKEQHGTSACLPGARTERYRPARSPGYRGAGAGRGAHNY
jgi:DNA-binding MarR family transcriptional regulator